MNKQTTLRHVLTLLFKGFWHLAVVLPFGATAIGRTPAMRRADVAHARQQADEYQRWKLAQETHRGH